MKTIQFSTGIALRQVGLALFVAALSVQATPPDVVGPVDPVDPGADLVKVALIGSSDIDLYQPPSFPAPPVAEVNPTYLPTGGPAGGLGDFRFTNLHPMNVSAANLDQYDIALLNVASLWMQDTTATLSDAAKTALMAWVAEGNKLIIYDSGCRNVDYSWLPYPFTTSWQPGAVPASLVIAEENPLSTSTPGDLHFIDAAFLATSTTAASGANVMVTSNPNWCVDMTGTNSGGFNGPVHAYAKYPPGSDTGLIIYNGLMIDNAGQSLIPAMLQKIWVQELQQPFNPSNLPCSVTAAGITLLPASATCEVGQHHTLTATLLDPALNPRPDMLVTFNVTAGPNTGLVGTDTTNADGQATFTYTSATAGNDRIQASFTDQDATVVISNTVTTNWVITNEPPVADAMANGQKTLTVEQSSHEGTPVTLDGSASSDPDGDVLIYEWDFDSDGAFEASGELVVHTWNLGGPYHATLRVTDPDGLSSTDTVEITVIDTTPPVITELIITPNVLWPPNHKMVPIGISASVTDVCDPEPAFRIVSVTSNQPENGLGDGDTAPDWNVTGDLDLTLRAERAGSKNPRIYTIAFVCTDISGNSTSATACVVVPSPMVRK